MSTFKRLLERARAAAESRVPDEVREAGRKLRDKVVERIVGAPAAADTPAAARPPASPSPSPSPSPAASQPATPAAAVDDTGGLAPADRLVVVYATAKEAADVAEIKRHFAGIDTLLKDFDLTREPQTHKQIAKLSGVEVPPYVFVNGRYWGGLYEIATLAVSGELEHVVANRLDRLGPEARRIGRLRDSYSDAVTVDNILARWRLGHILCVDDLDAWLKLDKDGVERFYYQGGERPTGDMEKVAAEIAAGVDDGSITAHWLLEPEVGLH